MALFPTETPAYCTNCGIDKYSFVHGTAAVVLFVCVAFDAWACTEETLVQLPDHIRRRFRLGYDVLAAAMIVAPVAVIAMTYIFGITDKKIFFVEWAGIVTFSAYWALKTYELSLSQAEKKAMMGQMPVVREVPAGKPSLRKRASRFLD